MIQKQDLLIKELKKKQKLIRDISELEKKKKDTNFIVDMERKITVAQAAKIDAEKKYKQSLQMIHNLESHIDLILEVDKHIPKITTIPMKKHCGGDGIANLLLGDWHCEEVVDSKEIIFDNSFNLKIAEQRAKKIVDIALRLIEIERYALDINKLVIYLLGDFISGYIHDELMISNSLTPAEALLFVEDLLMTVVSSIVDGGKFKKVDVICHCGNHARYTNSASSNKQHHKGQAKKTFEWILYHQMAKLFQMKKNTNVNFIIPASALYINHEFSFPIRSQHGSNFRYNGGIGGASVSINRKLSRWNDTSKAYLDVFGHFHMFDSTRKYICNGSLIGYNQFAQNLGYEYEHPKQAIFFIEKKRGLVSTRPIYLEEKENGIIQQPNTI